MDDVTSGLVNTQQSSFVMVNDSAAVGVVLDHEHLRIFDPATSTWTLGPVATANGTYEVVTTVVTQPAVTISTASFRFGTAVVKKNVNVRTMSLVFTPALDYVGVADPIRYEIIDELGQTANAKYTPTVLPVELAFTGIKDSALMAELASMAMLIATGLMLVLRRRRIKN